MLNKLSGERAMLLILLVLAAWSAVVTLRASGRNAWDPMTLVYTVVIAALALFVLQRLGIAP